MGVSFDPRSARRIVEAVKRIEATPRNLYGERRTRRNVASSGSGTSILWAEVTGVTDKNNYTVSIWTTRSSYENGDAASETDKQCRVPKIQDALSIGDDFGVEASTLTGEDYIAIQQIGLM